MSGYNTYVGARYVPIIDGEWDRTKKYEPLIIVTNNGDSYTSKTYVPIGIDITNTNYWVKTGDYNAQVAHYTELAQDTRNKLDKIGFIVEPSGDFSGKTDKQNIQNALNNYHNVQLTKGAYYINDSIVVIGNDILKGIDAVNTIIYVTSDISAIKGKENTSVDYLTIANMQIRNNISNSTKPCMDFVYEYTKPYLGARYSVFDNLWARNFKVGIDCSVMWDTRFSECRFDECDISINIGNSCNNIFFENCQFYGKTDSTVSSVGVKSTSRDNTENHNYTFINCDFEKLSYGCDLTATIGCNFYGCYFEKVTNGFKLDSCPSTVINGGNFNGIEKVARITKSYTSARYDGTYEFSDFVVSLNSDTETEIIVIAEELGKVYAHNISIFNSGSGEVTYTNIDRHKYRCGSIAKACREYKTNRMRYSSDAITFKFNNVATNEQIKLQNIYLTVVETSVQTINNISIDVYDTNTNKIGTCILRADTYTKGQKLKITPLSTVIKDVTENEFVIKPSNDPGRDISFDFEATAYVGEFRTPKLFPPPVL